MVNVQKMVNPLVSHLVYLVFRHKIHKIAGIHTLCRYRVHILLFHL